MMDKYFTGPVIRVKPVYEQGGKWIGSVEVWGPDENPWYCVDNWLARKFDIMSHARFQSIEEIMDVINGG